MSGLGHADRPQDRWALPATCLYSIQLTACSDVTPYFKQCNLRALQASLQQPDLWYEAQLLRRLMYKNHSQHRSSHFMRQLRAVSRVLSNMEALALPAVIADLDRMTQLADAPLSAAKGAQSKAAATSGTRGSFGYSSSASQTHNVPCQEACAVALARLLAGARVAQGLIRCCIEAAEKLAAQVAKSFFMPLCITGIAMLARIQALSMQHVLACISAYNSLAGLIPILPARSSHASDSAAQRTELVAALPQSVQCAWQGKIPQVTCQSEHGGQADSTVPRTQRQVHWVRVQAQRLWDELGLMQGLEATYMGPATEQPTELAGTAICSIVQATERGASLLAGTTAVPLEGGTGAVHIPHTNQQRTPAVTGTVAASAAARHMPRKSAKEKAAVEVAAAPGVDQRVKVNRQSFFDMMAASKPGSQKAGALGALHNQPAAQLPTQPLGVFIDQGPAAAKRKRGIQPATKGTQPAMPSTAEASSTVAPVYMTSTIGLLGLGLGAPTPDEAERVPASNGLDAVAQTEDAQIDNTSEQMTGAAHDKAAGAPMQLHLETVGVLSYRLDSNQQLRPPMQVAKHEGPHTAKQDTDPVDEAIPAQALHRRMPDATDLDSTPLQQAGTELMPSFKKQKSGAPAFMRVGQASRRLPSSATVIQMAAKEMDRSSSGLQDRLVPTPTQQPLLKEQSGKAASHGSLTAAASNKTAAAATVAMATCGTAVAAGTRTSAGRKQSRLTAGPLTAIAPREPGLHECQESINVAHQAAGKADQLFNMLLGS